MKACIQPRKRASTCYGARGGSIFLSPLVETNNVSLVDGESFASSEFGLIREAILPAVSRQYDEVVTPFSHSRPDTSGVWPGVSTFCPPFSKGAAAFFAAKSRH